MSREQSTQMKCFRQAKQQIHSDTMISSNTRAITEHLLFKDLVSQGESLITYVLIDMQINGWSWTDLHLLGELTSTSPHLEMIGGEDRSYVSPEEIYYLWLAWGVRNGHLPRGRSAKDS